MASARGAKKLSGWAFEQVRASKTRAYKLGGNRERARARIQSFLEAVSRSCALRAWTRESLLFRAAFEKSRGQQRRPCHEMRWDGTTRRRQSVSQSVRRHEGKDGRRDEGWGDGDGDGPMDGASDGAE